MLGDIPEEIIEGLILALKRTRDRKHKEISEEEIQTIVEEYIDSTLEDPIMRFVWDLVIVGRFDIELVDGEICIIIRGKEDEHDTSVYDGGDSSEREEYMDETRGGKTLDPSDYES